MVAHTTCVEWRCCYAFLVLYGLSLSVYIIISSRHVDRARVISISRRLMPSALVQSTLTTESHCEQHYS